MGVHSKLSTPSWPPRGLLAALHGYEATHHRGHPCGVLEMTLSMSALRSVSFFERPDLKNPSFR